MNKPTEVKISIFNRFTWWLKDLFAPKPPSGLIEHAKRELLLAGYPALDEYTEHLEKMTDPDICIQENVFELLQVLADQGHSGSSAPYCIDLFAKLARYELLTPLTGEDDEWIDRTEENGEPLWQNKRCSHVFKDGKHFTAYDSQGIIFREPDGACYTSAESRVLITFPYTPVTKYVDVKEW
jgi:hypothetical protein